ncbi:DUF5955 family protein [Streptomyces sp. NPDC089919]|uniref:DUF5955 family protein n=1 Tax=Streptomyces sp. NPDC089919 TaxID=3155188 RepID=UPI003440646A
MEGEEDTGAAALRAAVSRLRRELAAYRGSLPERAIAEDELATLAGMAPATRADLPRLHRCLLTLAGALGSVSALAPALKGVREAVEGVGRGA